MNRTVHKMITGTALFVSLLVTLCLCRYNDIDDLVVRQKKKTIYYEREQIINVVPGDVYVKVDIDTSEPVSHIEEYFISFNIDSQEFSEHFEKMNFRLLFLWAFVCYFCMIDHWFLIRTSIAYACSMKIKICGY